MAQKKTKTAPKSKPPKSSERWHETLRKALEKKKPPGGFPVPPKNYRE